MNNRGFTLVEVMVALMVLLVVTAGVLPLTLVATKTAENQGHLMSRTTEYAQDKLEQLLALAYGDTASDTRVFPATDEGGTGLTVDCVDGAPPATAGPWPQQRRVGATEGIVVRHGSGSCRCGSPRIPS